MSAWSAASIGLATLVLFAHHADQRAIAEDVASDRNIVHHDIVDAVQHAPLAMLYDGDSADACRTWQQKFRRQLERLLGDSTPPSEWTIGAELGEPQSDHLRLDLLLEAPHVPQLPLYLLIPTGASPDSPRPAVLCVHGHGPLGNDALVGQANSPAHEQHIAQHNYDYALDFVRRGYVVAVPCLIPFGRRVDRESYGGNDPCAVTFVRMQALGRLPITANLRDLRWSLDYLESRPEVANDRLGCAGLSYGGRMTMMVTAIDPRIRVACISGALNLLQERMTLRHSCGAQMIPGLLNYGDYSEIGSLIAPRPCVWEVGSDDPLIDDTWCDLFRQRLRRAYASFRAAEQLHFDDFRGGHAWSGRVALPLFDKVLKN